MPANTTLFRLTHWSLGISLIVLSATVFAAPNEPSNAAWNINMNPDGTDPSAYFGEWTGHTYYPSPEDWREESVYQFITDRFADGNPKNNDGEYGGYNLDSIYDRHGGDFAGIMEKLDYIKSLGYTTIWISPVFQNRHNSYHGYGQIDFTLLDDRFGTLAEFRAMVEAAHERDIKVIVDIIVNHMSDLYYFSGHPSDGAPFQIHNGEYQLIPRNADESYRDFPVDNTWFDTGTYHQVYSGDGNAYYDVWGTGSYWNSDFHHNGDLGDYQDPWQNHLGKIYGSLDDLRTSHPRVQDKLIAMTQSLVESTDIDGIRMDTPMQVPLEFFKRWVPAVKNKARELGKDNFFIFGEYYVQRERAATMTGRGRTPDMYGRDNYIDDRQSMDAGIHYPVFHWFQNALRQQQPGHLGALMDTFQSDLPMYDFYNPDRAESRYRHLSFYNNHDQERIAQSEDGFLKTDLASAIITFWPGIPLFYYGDEQGLLTQGSALDGWSREDMMTSLAWDELPTVEGRNPAEGDNFNMTNPHFLWVQKLMNIRRQYPALRRSDNVEERWSQPDDDNGIYAYLRKEGTPQEWALVVWNTWKHPLSAGGVLGEFNTGWAEGDRIINVLDPAEIYTLGANGSIAELAVNGYEAKLFVREDNLQPLDPVVNMVSPAHDERVLENRWTIVVQFSEPMDEASVKAAFRLNGAEVNEIDLTYDAELNQLQYEMTTTDGIHYVTVDESATSTAGKGMYGTFQSRFVKGNDDNVLVDNSRKTDPTLVEVVDAENSLIKLRHKATGAEQYRVFVNEWTPWMDYAPVTDYTLPTFIGEKALVVQYYADNSAAYFVETNITNTQPLPEIFLRGTFNNWANSAMPHIGEHEYELDVLLEEAPAHQMKFDLLGDWSLNYGDDNSDGIADSAGENILVPTAGSYRVRFNAQSLAYSVTPVETEQPPVANAGPDQQVRINSLVQFDGALSSDTDGNIVSYSWSNGLTGVEASQIYNVAGTYAVILTVVDNDGLSGSDDVVITVQENHLPVADAGVDQTVTPGTTVTLSALNSQDPDGSIESYLWSTGAATPDITITLDTVGVFEYTVTVTDNDAAEASANVTVTVVDAAFLSNQPSMHIAGTFNDWNITTTPMELIQDNMWETSIVFESAGRFKFVPVDWALSFGDINADGVADSDGGGDILITAPGTYIVNFNDETLAYSAEGQFAPQAPIADAGIDFVVKVGESAQLDASASSDSDGNIMGYSWSNGLSGATPVITYTETGIHTVVLTVTDNDGLSDTDDVVITVVSNQAPVADAGADQSISVGSTITLSATASSDTDGTIVSYLWSTGETSQEIDLAMDTVGSFNYTVEVTDNDGATASATVTVTVVPPSQDVTVTFACANGATSSGTSVYVVGDHELLGNWSVSSDVQLLNPDNYPVWSGTMTFPAGANVQWKCVKANENSLAITQWQSGSNNSFTTTDSPVSTTGNF